MLREGPKTALQSPASLAPHLHCNWCVWVVSSCVALWFPRMQESEFSVPEHLRIHISGDVKQVFKTPQQPS